MKNVTLSAPHVGETQRTSIGVTGRKYYPKYTLKTKHGGATSYVQYDPTEENSEITNPIQNHEY